MKKYILISAAALLALAACSKVNQAPEAASQQEIGFQVANYMQQTKAGAQGKFEYDSFGTYSWFNNGTEAEPFMVNEIVMPVGTTWKTTAHTYYWPKTGNIDFFSYYPYDEKGTMPTITQGKIVYTDYEVKEEIKTDLMYADPAPAQTHNVTTYYTEGVPTLFHHALTKVAFQIKANFLEYGEEGDKTKWEITLNEATLWSFHRGTLEMAWSADKKTWTLPTDKMWTISAEGRHFGKELIPAVEEKPGTLPLTVDFQALGDEDGYFMIPQPFTGSNQELQLSMTIKTYLPDHTEENPHFITETFEPTIKFDGKDLPKWEMNKNILYKISIKPTRGSDPDNPDDPKDDTILFDPAVEGWDPEIVNVPIQL